MSDTVLETRSPAGRSPLLYGANLLSRFQRLLGWATAMLVIYSVASTGSRSIGVGGFSGDGFVDNAGKPTRVAPTSYDLTLHPSPIVYLAIILAILWTIPKVLRKARTEAQAVRIIDRAVLIVVAIALGSIAIGTGWFFAMPFDPSGNPYYLYPLPFGTVEFHIDPISNH